uniref:Multidrug and toxin extrusion protein n=1 Tax=Oncorhynchus kisutch TaxID=8019 RepID=A0A8C7MID0_ONCKI
MDSNGIVESRMNGNELTICGSCLRCIRRLIPVEFKKEILELSTMAGPVVMAQLMVFLVSFVSTIFCGHLGKTELAGVTLAIAVINVTGVSIGYGLSSACDTLISQTFGSRNLLKVGVIVQRAILIQLLACFPCWAVLINTEPILLAVKQSPEVARLSQVYVKIFMPALPATFIYQLEARYLQNQGIIWPQVITGVVANVLNALINYIFLYVLDLGVAGSAWANTISQFSLAAILYAYILWKELHKATWAGWSWECLEDWGTYIHLAIPSMIMLCVEWWTYEIGGFLAGMITDRYLGCFDFPLGFSVAGSVRVGSALGAGDTEQAKLSAKLAMFCAGTCACQTPQMIFQSLTTAASGSIIRGAGKQKVGAICNILGYYGVGFPIGVSLMFAAKLGIMGLWTGLFTCVFLQSSFLIVYLSRMNWKKATVEVNTGITNRNALAEDGAEAGDRVALNKVGALLAHRALIMQRALALCVMLFILALGIIINLLLTNLT